MISNGDVDDFLSHYGVPGMKWGVRRANPSGISNRQKRKAGKKADRLDRRANRRDNLTKQLREVNNAEAAQLRRISSGKKTTNDLMKVVGQATLAEIVTAKVNGEAVSKTFARNRMEGIENNRKLLRARDSASTANRNKAKELRKIATTEN